MSLNQISSAQLDALRLLLADDSLRNVLQSQNFASSLGTGTNSNDRSATRSAPKSKKPILDSLVGQIMTSAQSSNRIIKTAQRGNKFSVMPRQPRVSAINAGSPKSRSKPIARDTGKTSPQRPIRNNRISIEEGEAEDDEAVDIPLSQTLINRNSRKFIIGIDYGTTFTSVSYHALIEGEDAPVLHGQVGIIRNWPHDSMHGVNMQVPTESWYSSIPRNRSRAKGQFEDSDAESESEDAAGITKVTNAEGVSPPIGSGLDHDASLHFLWGYQVPYQRYRQFTTRNPDRHIERAKLMLVGSKFSKHTDEDRARLRPRLSRLISTKIIRKFGTRDEPDARDVQDVISDFLVPVLRHTCEQLVNIENFEASNCSVSFTLTVPTIWSSKSSRVLQYALEDAIQITGFGTLAHGSVNNLFIVSEPEAAATYLLGNSRTMQPGETFTVMDCGGGTVDGSTYSVTTSYPLRLGREICRPSGDNCGASYLNENFEKLLLEKLANEKYLEQNGDTLESIVKGLVPNFEDFDKRTKDIYDSPSARFKISGLRGDRRRNLFGKEANGFENNFLLLYPQDYKNIFLPLLKRTGAVLKTQLDAAKSLGRDVKKVFLIGGFGAAPSLRRYLKTFLQDYVTEKGLSYSIDLILSDEQTCVTAVSSGAVLRAMNIKNGPARVPHSSYGFLRIQPFEPDFEGHQQADPEVDKLDGKLYITVIEYFMLGAVPYKTRAATMTFEEHLRLEEEKILDPVHTFEPTECRHAFAIDCPRFLCEEVLYVHDSGTKSSYPLHHACNQGAQVVGKIVTDMTFLRNERKLLPVHPVLDENGELKGEIHYEVTYDLVVIVEGRNLRYEARYPAGSAGKALATGQISIAAAFRPGTS